MTPVRPFSAGLAKFVCLGQIDAVEQSRIGQTEQGFEVLRLRCRTAPGVPGADNTNS